MSSFQLSRDGYVGVDRTRLKGGDVSRPSSSQQQQTVSKEKANVKSRCAPKPKVSSSSPSSSSISSSFCRKNSAVTASSTQVERARPSRMHYRTFNQGVEEEYSREKSKLWMKRVAQEAKNKSYGAHVYGSKDERSKHKSEIRQGLLQQIEQKHKKSGKKTSTPDPTFEEMLALSKAAEERDRELALERKSKLRNVAIYNQRQIDKKKALHEEKKRQEQQRDRSLWGVDPINWSRTLS
eukprot:m.5274 g.5274  ORF g.5274 m.5274 type:complete len:238 (+) comp4177_c1_seq1:156-869(+)